MLIRPNVLALACMLLLAACSGSDDRPAPSVSPDLITPATSVGSTSPTASPASSADYFNAVSLAAGDPVPLPSGTVLVARDGVWEGAGGNLRRYYMDAAGQMRMDNLLISRHAGDPFALTQASVAGTGTLIAAMCHGVCYGQPEPISTLVSADGGVTWQSIYEADASDRRRVLATDNGLTTILESQIDDTWKLFERRNGGDLSPVAISDAIPPRSQIVVGYTANGPLLAAFENDRRTVWDVKTGKVLVEIPVPNPFQKVWVQGFRPGSEGRELLVTWYGPGDANTWDWYLGILSTVTGKFSAVVRGSQSEGTAGMYAVHWLDEHRAIARVEFDAARYVPGQASWFRGTPALVDFQQGSASPIETFVPGLADKAGGPVPVAVEVGDFRKVATGTDCLNVRSGPTTSDPVLACSSGGVMLRLREEAAPVGGWTAVEARDGQPGWAASEYLAPP